MRFLTWGAAGCVALAAYPVHAQRAGENAVTSAQDAFGTTVGSETIGLYSATDVRGFSPTEAGNLRLEGLYFDRQGDTTTRIVSRNTVRVGLSAQSYPFPAPTGIGDYQLRIPGYEQVTSAIVTFGPFRAGSVEVDSQIPIIAERLSLAFGIGGYQEALANGTAGKNWNVGGMLRWQPNDTVEIIPVASVNMRYDRRGALTVTTAGAFLPPEIDRSVYYGQDWVGFSATAQSTMGFYARANFGDWELRTGWYRSMNYRLKQGENLFRNTQPDGTTDRFGQVLPGNKLSSWSGEMRLSREFIEGPRRHTVHGSFRGRLKTRTFGGGINIPLGPGQIGVPDPEPFPSYTFGPLSKSKARQGNVGVAYEGLWPEVGEASVGVQKAFYERRSDQPGLPSVYSKDNPWLVNGTMALYLSNALVAYSSFTRGLEESGEAPQNAVNRGESVPASRTTQVDAGLRYAITPSLRLVAGVFQVTKPFFNLDTANVFTQLGDVRHRGVELSLTGQPLEGLTVVAGTVLLQARVTGAAVTSGRIGAEPLGRFPRVSRLNLQYGPKAWAGFSVDGQVENISGRYVNILNTARAPGYTTLNLGARYVFRKGTSGAALRFQAQNLTDTFAWTISPTAAYTPIDQRRFTLSLTVDF
jgi:iron complex outermembrane receptor protein